MKIVITIPDELFRSAEAAAHGLRISRDQLYAKAISELLNREAVTERLNEIYSRDPATVDAAWQSAQLESLDEDSW